MKRRITGLFITAFVLVFCFTSNEVCAGEINSAEQRLIGVISGTFSYNGKNYVVKNENIAQGRSKLAEDGVDLSDAEADSYIAQFHNSYGELVEEGYCNETGESSSGTADEKSKEEEASGNGEDTGDKGDESKNQGEEDEKKDTGHTKAEQAKNKLFLQTVFGEPEKEEETSDAEWMEEEDLGTVLDFNQSDLTAAKKQKVVLYGSDKQNFVAINVEPQTSQEGENPVDRLLHLEQWKIISYVIFGFSVCTAVGIVWYILAVRRRKRKKRKIRLGLAVASGISMAGCAFLLMAVLGLYFGVYNKEAIHRQLMESDYYSGITQMTRELAAQTLQESGYDGKIAAEVFSLSHVYIEEKQYIDGILSGEKENQISVKAIDKVLEEQLKETDQKKKDAVVENVNDIYKNTLQFEMGKVIRESKEGFLPWCYGVTGISCLLLLFLFGLTYQMYGYLHKSARVSSVGIFLSSLVIAGVSFAVKLQRLASQIHAEPIYYQQFLQKYVNWSVNVMFYVGCIGLLAAVALTIWKRYLHMIYVD